MLFLEVTNPTFSYIAPVLMAILAMLVAILLVVLPTLSHALWSFIKAKTGITLSEANRKRFVDIVDNIVLQVEQLARKALKLGEEAPEGAKKLEDATDKVEKRLKDTGLYDEFKEEIADQIEASVAMLNGGPLTALEKNEIKAALPATIEVDKDDDEKPKKIIGGTSTK